MILLDTNLLGRVTDSTDPQCAIARRAISLLCSGTDRPVIVPQSIFEFWAVATRSVGPAPNGKTDSE